MTSKTSNQSYFLIFIVIYYVLLKFILSFNYRSLYQAARSAESENELLSADERDLWQSP